MKKRSTISQANVDAINRVLNFSPTDEELDLALQHFSYPELVRMKARMIELQAALSGKLAEWLIAEKRKHTRKGKGTGRIVEGDDEDHLGTVRKFLTEQLDSETRPTYGRFKKSFGLGGPPFGKDKFYRLLKVVSRN